MTISLKIQSALDIIDERPVTFDSLLRFQALYEEAQGEEARQIGMMWEGMLWVTPSDLLVEWEAYRKEQKANGGR